jgi:predicted aldo/keto reductase-like oxidoreductase
MSERKDDLSRRKFMATSVGALATAGLATVAPSLARAQEKTASSDEKTGKTIRRTLGRTGLEMPIVSMGAGACNDPALVSACYDSGMRMFDTAANYGYGRNEQMVANALHKSGVRDKSLVMTKVLTPAQRAGLTPEQTGAKLKELLDGSLKRLKTDCVDILLVHDIRDPETVHNEAIKKALLEVKKEGKVKFVGTATHSRMAEVINATVEAEIYDVVLTSFNFTMATDTEMMQAVANAAKKNVGVIAMKALAGGGRFPNPETLRNYDNSVVTSAALKWVLRNENIATSIPGIGTFDHMRANFAVAGNLEYTEEEESFLSDNSITLGMGFCRQCSKCLASCPKDVEIPDLMRTHMYAKQYADFGLARQTLGDIPAGRGFENCTSCDSCTARCVNSVNIPNNIDELKLIYG